MKFSPLSVVAAALCVAGAVSSPISKTKRTSISDVDVLQFALTLEHLENAFYKQALTLFSEAEFLNAGFDSAFVENLEFVAFDEQSHVEVIIATITQLGGVPVNACQYNFPFSDVTTFVQIASVLEGVGVSAYLGAAGLIQSKQVLNAAASITVAEGLHQAVQRASILEVVSANIVGTPLSPEAVLTIATQFISSCPSTNAQLPFTALPAMSVAGGSGSGSGNNTSISGNNTSVNANSTSISGNSTSSSAKKTRAVAQIPVFVSLTTSIAAGSALQLSVASGTTMPATVFLTFISGLDVVSVAAQVSGSNVVAAIPSQVSGQTYVVITSAEVSNNALDESVLVTGPVIVEIVPSAPQIDFGEI